MLTDTIERANGTTAVALLRGAQVALNSDIDTARECLRLLEGMLHPAPALSTPRPPKPPTSARGGLAAWQINAVTAHIELNLGKTIGIAELASLTRLSKGHFCRAFKASMEETAHTYITRQRVARAQRLMMSTTDTLSAIAYACGLSDQAHLTRLFRRFVSQTPLAWRRACQQVA